MNGELKINPVGETSPERARPDSENIKDRFAELDAKRTRLMSEKAQTNLGLDQIAAEWKRLKMLIMLIEKFGGDEKSWRSNGYSYHFTGEKMSLHFVDQEDRIVGTVRRTPRGKEEREIIEYFNDRGGEGGDEAYALYQRFIKLFSFRHFEIARQYSRGIDSQLTPGSSRDDWFYDEIPFSEDLLPGAVETILRHWGGPEDKQEESVDIAAEEERQKFVEDYREFKANELIKKAEETTRQMNELEDAKMKRELTPDEQKRLQSLYRQREVLEKQGI